MDEYITKTYGVENLAKIKRNLSSGLVESKRRFLAEYPHADTSKFEFSSTLTKTGDIDKYTVFYKIGDGESYDITSNTLKNNKKWTKHLNIWPGLWDVNGTVQRFESAPEYNYNLSEFNVYVTESDFFVSEFSGFETSWNKSDTTDPI